MKVVIDMDEVMTQFVQKVLDRWNDEHGTSFVRDQIDTWQMERTLGEGSWGVIDRWCGERGFFLELEPVPGAIRGFETLLAAGHDVVVATAVLDTANNCYDDKRAWMRGHFPRWPIRNFIAVSRKGLLQADVLVDDGAHNIEDWMTAGNGGAVIFDTPWNRSVPNRTNGREVHRAYGWTDVVRIIGEIEERKKSLTEPFRLDD